jgi:isoleucyl-tRNA synthetase
METALEDLLPLVMKELNVEEISFARDADRFVEYGLKPNFKLIGPRLGRKVQALKKVLAEADAPALRASIEETGSASVEVEGETVTLSREEIEVNLVPRQGYAAGAGRGVVLVLETEVTSDLVEKWYARELIARVNSLRSDRALKYESRIRLKVWCGEVLKAAFEKHAESIRRETLSVSIEYFPLEAAGGAAEGRAGDHAFRVDLEEV